MKNLQKFILILLVLVTLFSYKNLNKYFNMSVLDFTKVIAEHEEEEEEEDHEDEKDHEEDEDDKWEHKTQDNTPTPSKEDFAPKEEVKEEPITYKEETFTEYVNVTEADYNKDSDGDKLVDAIDPDPKKSQLDYFTDSDFDGVPNAYDLFEGKNDFLYIGNTDENSNGIVDSYE